MAHENGARITLCRERHGVLIKRSLQRSNELHHMIQILARNAPSLQRLRHTEALCKRVQQFGKSLRLALGGPIGMRLDDIKQFGIVVPAALDIEVNDRRDENSARDAMRYLEVYAN